jgi:hypothetical protein
MNFNEMFIYDDGLLINKKTNHIYSHVGDSGYNMIWIKGKNYAAHRIIWQMFNGPIDGSTFIDHIDKDRLNNRIENLRIATRSQNAANSKVPKSKTNSLPKGVYFDNSGTKYKVGICYNQESIHLGTFSTIDEAANTYKEAASILFGEYASV